MSRPTTIGTGDITSTIDEGVEGGSVRLVQLLKGVESLLQQNQVGGGANWRVEALLSPSGRAARQAVASFYGLMAQCERWSEVLASLNASFLALFQHLRSVALRPDRQRDRLCPSIVSMIGRPDWPDVCQNLELMSGEAGTTPWSAAALGQQLAQVLASRHDESVQAWTLPDGGGVTFLKDAADTAAAEPMAMEETEVNAKKALKRKSMPQGGKAKKKMAPKKSM
jgi:hypothetical protein